MNIRKNDGITLIALVITVIMLLIISGISITGTVTDQKQAEANVQIAELDIIQHAILERYVKSQLTKEELPGTIMEITEVTEIVKEINKTTGQNIDLKGTEYRKLQKSDLAELGITGEKDIYIVNYKTGEVINQTQKVTKTGVALYIYSKSEK